VAVPWFLRSRARLLLTIVLALTLPTTVLLLVVTGTVRAHLRDRAVEQSGLAARLIARSVDQELYGLGKYVESFARRPSLDEAAAAGDVAAMDEQLRAMLALNPKLSRVAITDANGALLADQPVDPAMRGVSFSDRDWFRAAAADPSYFISKVFRRREAPQPWVVAISCRIGADAPRGVLVAQWSASDIADWLERVRGPYGAEALLLDPDGQLVTREGPPRLVRDAPVIVDLATRPGGWSQGPPPLGEGPPSLVVGRPVGRTGWSVVVHQPLSRALAPMTATVRTILGAFTATLMATLALGLVWYRTLREYDQGQRRRPTPRSRRARPRSSGASPSARTRCASSASG
jgi:hypothetical protein